MKNYTLKGKTVVITGGSSGVGRAVAEAFALQGSNLVLAARGKKGLDEAVNTCKGLGALVIGIPTDVSDYEQIENLVSEALKLTGTIDIWVNNAGVMASGRFEEIPIAVSQQVVKTNLIGYLNSTHAILPIFKAQEYGVLINNVSIGGFMPAPYSAVYSSTKGGIRLMMECLQGEISDQPDIHICNLYPQIQRSTGNMHSAKYSGLDFKVPPFAADPRDTATEIIKLAKSPKKDKFPDINSWILKTMHSLFPETLVNIASATMRLMMKLKDAPPTDGNVLLPSAEPHQVYGETIIPVPSKQVKVGFMVGLGLSLSFLLLLSKRN